VLPHGDVDFIPLDRFPFDCAVFGPRPGQPGTTGNRWLAQRSGNEGPARSGASAALDPSLIASGDRCGMGGRRTRKGRENALESESVWRACNNLLAARGV
jgi:hypothetical protein